MKDLQEDNTRVGNPTVDRLLKATGFLTTPQAATGSAHPPETEALENRPFPSRELPWAQGGGRSNRPDSRPAGVRSLQPQGGRN
jgi:hypothetical protein